MQTPAEKRIAATAVTSASRAWAPSSGTAAHTTSPNTGNSGCGGTRLIAVDTSDAPPSTIARPTASSPSGASASESSTPVEIATSIMAAPAPTLASRSR